MNSSYLPPGKNAKFFGVDKSPMLKTSVSYLSSYHHVNNINFNVYPNQFLYWCPYISENLKA